MTEWSKYHTGVSKPTTIRGVTYPSRWAAAKALNCTPSNVYKAAQEGWLDRVGARPHRWREEMVKREAEDAKTHAVELEAKLTKALEVLEAALKYNTAMHGGAAAYNQRIKDAIAELKGQADG
jgi:hypothetical protein